MLLFRRFHQGIARIAWTLPELQELLLEAGFARTDVYVEGWDEEADDTDGVFRRRARFENMSGWVAYVVGTC